VVRRLYDQSQAVRPSRRQCRDDRNAQWDAAISELVRRQQVAAAATVERSKLFCALPPPRDARGA
jgi:hypothetical protein